jgi:VWFA-related protein
MRGIALFLALLAAASPAVAQEAQTDQTEAPSFPAQAELVLADAVVLDAKGNPVEGLRQDEFVLREDGVSQTIVRFEAVGLQESEATSASAPRFISSNTGKAEPHKPPRSFAIVFDDAQLSQASGEGARKAVAKFVREGVRDDDEILLASTSGGVWWSGRGAVARADVLTVLDRLQGRRLASTSGDRISDYEAMRIYVNRDSRIGAEVLRRFAENSVALDPGNQNEAQVVSDLDISRSPLVMARATEAYVNAKARNEATLRTLERVADALAQGRGRKAVLLVSDGFVYDSSLPEFKSVVRAMSRANAAIYFLDARGLTGADELSSAEYGIELLEQDQSSTLARAPLETEGSESVAVDTGGFSFRNPNNLLGGMEKAADEQKAYYLIGYIPTNARHDGKFRKISVEVHRPDLKVRARKGYYAPVDGKPEPRTAHGLDAHLRQALDSPYAADAIPLRMASYVFGPSPAGKTAVLIAADVDPSGFAFEESHGRFDATLDSYVVVAARDNSLSIPEEKEIALSLPPEVKTQLAASWLPVFRSFELGPGVYQARLLVRDRKSGRIGTVRHEFEVPAPGHFRLSTPILTDALQADPKAGAPRPVPLARRTFATGGNLLYLFEVYGADTAVGEASRVSVRYEVRREDGTVLVHTEPATLSADPQGRMSRELPISLEGVPPGSYEIILDVKDLVSGQAVEVRDPFTVSPTPPSSPSPRRP